MTFHQHHMDNPLVSIIVTSFNHKEYLEQSIESVLNQTYSNIELIVTDDCSTDGSDIVLQNLALTGKFIYLQNRVNKGLNNSIISALKDTTGEFIGILASDDYMVVDKIEKQVKYLISTKKDAVFSTGFSLQDGKTNLIKLDKVFLSNDKAAMLKYVYTHDWGAPLMQSGLFNKTLFNALRPVRAEFKSDDWAFLIKCFEEYNTGYIHEPLFYYRIHSENTHKRYWFTFPMRIDVASRLVPQKYRVKSLSNIMLSQGTYLLHDRKVILAWRFFISSLVLHFSIKKLIIISKAKIILIKNLIHKPKIKS
ncbi:MAG: glycosyltransferase [Ferruginibacter sp.]